MPEQQYQTLSDYFRKRDNITKTTKTLNINEEFQQYLKEVSVFYKIDMRHFADNIIADWILRHGEEVKAAKLKRLKKEGY